MNRVINFFNIIGGKNVKWKTGKLVKFKCNYFTISGYIEMRRFIVKAKTEGVRSFVDLLEQKNCRSSREDIKNVKQHIYLESAAFLFFGASYVREKHTIIRMQIHICCQTCYILLKAVL